VKRKILIACILALSLALALPALAQDQAPPPPPPGGPGGPGGPEMGPPPDLALKDALTLTDDQLASLKSLDDIRRQSVHGIMPQIQSAEKAMADALKSSSPDPQQLVALQIAVKGYRDQIRAADQTMAAGFRALLTPAQQAKLDSYLAMKDAVPVLMALRHLGF
jgi:Spy/CpxP family protein refolding chaperone